MGARYSIGMMAFQGQLKGIDGGLDDENYHRSDVQLIIALSYLWAFPQETQLSEIC